MGGSLFDMVEIVSRMMNAKKTTTVRLKYHWFEDVNVNTDSSDNTESSRT